MTDIGPRHVQRPARLRLEYRADRAGSTVFLFIETMPYGGVGTSGIGHYYGKHGFDALTQAKSILVSPPDVAIDHLFPPYTEEKVKALAQWFDY